MKLVNRIYGMKKENRKKELTRKKSFLGCFWHFVIRSECQLYFNQLQVQFVSQLEVEWNPNFRRWGLFFVSKRSSSGYTCFATKITRMSRAYAAHRYKLSPFLNPYSFVFSLLFIRRIVKRNFQTYLL